MEVLAALRAPGLIPNPALGEELLADGSVPALIFMTGEEHRVHRRVVAPPFSRRQLSSLEPQIRRYAQEAIAQLLPDDAPRRVRLGDEFAWPLVKRTFSSLLGLCGQQIEDLIPLGRGIISNDLSPLRKRLAALRLYKAVTALVDKRSAPDGVVERLKHASTPTGDIVGAVMTMLVSGATLSVRGLLGCISASVGQDENPVALDNHELDDLLSECPIVRTVERVAIEETRLGSNPVPPGSRVKIVVAGPHAADQPSVPFGIGPHYCLGAPLIHSLCRAALGILTTTVTLSDCEPTHSSSDYPFGGVVEVIATAQRKR
ncbi:MAG: hypothetical protein ACRDVP_02740 [Acidimicrobiales bacterium]